MKIQLSESELISLIKKIVNNDETKTIYEDIYGSVESVNLLNEAEYQGRKVQLGKIMQGDIKKFKVEDPLGQDIIVIIQDQDGNLDIGRVEHGNK